MPVRTLFALVLAVSSATAQPTSTRWALSDRVDEVLADEDFRTARWGVHVADLESGEVLYSRNAYASFIPASNMKLVTTAVALEALGASHRFETRLYAIGEVAYGTLSGSLVLRGSGDPAFEGRRSRSELRELFQSWAAALRDRRIRAVLGPLLVADDAVEDPDPYAARLLAETLRDDGVSLVDPTVIVLSRRQVPDFEALEPLATYRSAPLSEYVRLTNEDSDNAYAERLLLAAAAQVYGGPAPREVRAAAVGSLLRRLGVDPRTVVVDDGSGLSRDNQLTPSGIVELLAVMWRHPLPATRAAFVGSLPVGGRTGTLRRRYRAGDARGNVRAKTGYIRGVRTLSGYVTTASGRDLAFSILCNGYEVRTGRVNRAQDAVVELLADFEGRRTVGG